MKPVRPTGGIKSSGAPRKRGRGSAGDGTGRSPKSSRSASIRTNFDSDERLNSSERLQKILARAGIASRRKAEQYIAEGRVRVNGETVTELGSKADPVHDHIRVDGKLIRPSSERRYYMLNKPRGYVTTVSDPQGRPTAMDFFSQSRLRMFPVGRLDYASDGLLLVTNDGAWANALTRAASGVEKTYLVKVSGTPAEAALEKLRRGVSISLGEPGRSPGRRARTAPAKIRLFRAGDNPWYEIVITEGRNRQIRKMFEEIGHHAEKIRRIAYGPLSLDVEPGEYRKLTEREVRSLTQAAGSRGGSSWPGLREPKAVRRSGGRVARESAE